MVLVHLGSEALKQGKTVVHYTLELQDTVVGNRYDSCISGVPLADLFHNKKQVLFKIQDIPGQLIIKEYPTKSASTETIKQHIERLKKRGIEPDMIIVDYADLLRPVRSSAEKRFDLENTYEELRAIAQIYLVQFKTSKLIKVECLLQKTEMDQMVLYSQLLLTGRM